MASRPSVGYRVEAVDADAGTVRRIGPKDKVLEWSPASSGDQAEAFSEVSQEFRTGDRVQFTCNNYAAKRLNGHTATVVELDTAAAPCWSSASRMGSASGSISSIWQTGMCGRGGCRPSTPPRVRPPSG